MLTVADHPYLDLDAHLPIQDLPSNIHTAIAKSYAMIKQNTWQKTTYLDGKVANCNWHSKETGAKSTGEFFAIEVLNKTVAPMWILDLTVDSNKNTKNLYDSLENPKQDWENIRFRTDLPKEWNPFLNWLKKLDCFDQIGRTSLLLTRPGVPPQYHRDIGVSDDIFTPYPHRQEFIWLKLTSEKTLYILDESRNPIQVKSKSAFFNHHNWHGSHNALPYWSFSFKIEGVFSSQFREQTKLSMTERYD